MYLCVKSQGYSGVLLITIYSLTHYQLTEYQATAGANLTMRENTMRKNNNSAGHDKPLTVPIEDLSEELFHFCFTPRILGLFNLDIKATYVNKAVDTAVTTAVRSLQALFRKKSVT